MRLRVFNKYKSFPQVVSFYSAVNIASGEVSVVCSLVCFNLNNIALLLRNQTLPWAGVLLLGELLVTAPQMKLVASL